VRKNALRSSALGFESHSLRHHAEILYNSLVFAPPRKRFGPAGDGEQYHHIVTQGGANADNIPPEQLQNTDNIIRLPTLLHEAVNAEYSKLLQDGTGMTMYQWLQTQSYDIQREEGLKILKRLNILK
jgi:hypothetical protein